MTRLSKILACNDVFPKTSSLRAGGWAEEYEPQEVASFRVVKKGLGCIPVLKVRDRMPGRQSAR
jgi:hypothetical protein